MPIQSLCTDDCIDEVIEKYSHMLSTFGATCTYELTQDIETGALEFIGTQIVMKDGSIVSLNPRSAAWNHDANRGEFSFQLDSPIVLAEADFVRLPDSVILPIE